MKLYATLNWDLFSDDLLRMCVICEGHKYISMIKQYEMFTGIQKVIDKFAKYGYEVIISDEEWCNLI